jgi:hypothetical protein
MRDPTLKLPLYQAIDCVAESIGSMPDGRARHILYGCAGCVQELLEERDRLKALNALLSSRLVELSRPPWWRRVLGLRGRHG